MVTVIPRKIAATSVNGVAVTNDGSITLPVDSTPTSNSTNLVTSGGVKTELDALTTGLAGKQDTLTFDTTPTYGSTNPVTSKGVYNAEYDTRNTIAIVVPGSIIRQDVAKGQYVIWQGALYTATQDIVSYTVPSTSILQAVQNGGLNAVKSSVDTLNSKMNSTLIGSSNISMNFGGIEGPYIGSENGFMIHLRIRTSNLSINNGQVLGVLSQQYTPSNAWSYIPLIDYDAGKPINGSIYLTSNGKLTYYGDNLSSKALYLSYMFFKN